MHSHPITVQNTGDSAKDYTLSHTPAATALTIDPVITSISLLSSRRWLWPA